MRPHHTGSCDANAVPLASREYIEDVRTTATAAKPTLAMMEFAGQRAWERWLRTHHRASPGVWILFAKKASGKTSVTYAEALEVALCYGWIDGQKRSHSATAWLQKFTPRGKKSIWSKINRAKALALAKTGRMRPAGLEEMTKAKRDGRWGQAYDSPGTATVPRDLRAALDASPRAKSFFASLDGGNRYAVLWRVQTAKKAETRAKRIAQFVAMLERGEKLHS
jgi:uncharacterized protein YdeI (YjbR/CyaY-like superfamily)